MEYQTLHSMTVVQLRKLAKEMQVKIPAGMNKAAIVERLLEKEASASPGANAAPHEISMQSPNEVPAPAEVEPMPEDGEEEPAESPEPIRAEEPVSEDGRGPKPSMNDGVFREESGLSSESDRPPHSSYVKRPFVRTRNYDRSNGYSDRGDEDSSANRPAYRTSRNRVSGQEGGDMHRNFDRRTGEYHRDYSAPRYSSEGYRRTSAEHPRRNYIPRYNSDESDAETALPRRPEESGAEGYRSHSPAENAGEGASMGDFSEGAGILELQPDGYGFLRAENCLPGSRDVYISIAQIRRFNLKNGDRVEGKIRPQREGDRYSAMIYVSRINGETPDKAQQRKPFETLIPVYPSERLRLENKAHSEQSLRWIDILAPIGKGQRGMIVSPPKAGKTTLLKQIANAITDNNPEVKLIVLLIDERPEEVTDMKRSIRGDVIYSTFDEAPENHTRVSEMVLEHARRLVEMGKDVVVLLDSITRLARAYNLVNPPTGRSLSGGLDPGALYKPKKFFGAARNIENGGSLTIIATALVDTGSRMDDIIYEEFKGTGNMELHLDRKLSEKRVFPAIDMVRSGTRREELLLTPAELEGAYTVRKMLANGNTQQNTETLIDWMEKTDTNADFFSRMKGWMSVYEKDGFSMGGNR